MILYNNTILPKVINSNAFFFEKEFGKSLVE